MMQSDLLGGAHRAASEIFHKRDAFVSGKCGKIGGGWRFDKATHKKIAPMHFQNERGLFADGAHNLRASFCWSRRLRATSRRSSQEFRRFENLHRSEPVRR